MFRTSILRAAFPAAIASRPAAVAPRVTALVVPRRVSVPVKPAGIRFYSAATGLNKEEVEGRIKDLLKGFDKVTDQASITGTSHFTKDLGLDSLDTVEVVMAIEEEFSIEIPDKDADSIHSVQQAVEYILSQSDAH